MSQVALAVNEIQVSLPIFNSEMRLLSPMFLDSGLLFQS
jgi:hypothetical protein